MAKYLEYAYKIKYKCISTNLHDDIFCIVWISHPVVSDWCILPCRQTCSNLKKKIIQTPMILANNPIIQIGILLKQIPGHLLFNSPTICDQYTWSRGEKEKLLQIWYLVYLADITKIFKISCFFLFCPFKVFEFHGIWILNLHIHILQALRHFYVEKISVMSNGLIIKLKIESGSISAYGI